MLKYQIVPVTAFEQNCSVLWCDVTKQAAVVDPGGDLDRINRVLHDNKLTLEKVLVTHGHIDHAGGVAELAQSYHVPIEGPHPGDDFWIEGIPNQAQMFGLSGQTFTPSRWMDEGDRIHFGQVELEVLHCPGHTPGHLVFFDRASKRAFVGDVLFAGSIGRTDFPGGDHDTLVNSITQKLWPLGDDVVFVPGHGPESSFGREKASNPFVADHRG